MYCYVLSISLFYLPTVSTISEGISFSQGQRMLSLMVAREKHERHAYVVGLKLKLNPANVTDGYIRSLVCGRMSSPFCVHEPRGLVRGRASRQTMRFETRRQEIELIKTNDWIRVWSIVYSFLTVRVLYLSTFPPHFLVSTIRWYHIILIFTAQWNRHINIFYAFVYMRRYDSLVRKGDTRIRDETEIEEDQRESGGCDDVVYRRRELHDRIAN